MMSARVSRVWPAIRQVHGSATSEVKTTTLSNGLRIVTQATPSGVANVGVFVKAGARDEAKAQGGTTNLIERLVYKGGRKLDQELESLGASLNSTVGAEQSSFVLRAQPQHVAQGVELLAEALANPALDDATVEVEKQAVLSQLQHGETGAQLVSRYLQETAFQGSGLANPVLGTSATVKAITKDGLKKHVADNHVGARLVVGATGNVDHDALVKLVEKAFGKLPQGVPQAAKVFPSFTGSEVRVRDDFQSEALFSIAVQGAPKNHDDYAPLLVASAIVGSYSAGSAPAHLLSSSLAQSVHQHKLASHFASFYTTFSDTGLWGITAATHTEAIEDLVYETQQTWVHLCKSATTNEVARAQQAVLHSLNDMGGLCTLNSLGSSILHYNKLLNAAALVEQVKDVTAGSVRKAASKYIYDKCPAVASFGPVEQFPDYNRLRGGMYWLRL